MNEASQEPRRIPHFKNDPFIACLLAQAEAVF
jgi:hypothetical protein